MFCVFQATDRDNNSVLMYSIESQAPGQFWQIHPNSGVITVNKPNNKGIKFKDGLSGRWVKLSTKHLRCGLRISRKHWPGLRGGGVYIMLCAFSESISLQWEYMRVITCTYIPSCISTDLLMPFGSQGKVVKSVRSIFPCYTQVMTPNLGF